MLTSKKQITFEGESKVNGNRVLTLRATIDLDDPSKLRLTAIRHSELLYRNHREEARVDQAAFEDAVYNYQSEMLKTNT